MTDAAWSGCIHQQDRPLCTTGTRRKRFIPFDDVTAIDFFHARAKPDRLAWLTRLRFTTPGDPLFTALDDAFKPARLLFFRRHTVEQHERVDVSLPATRQ